jgi:hypothetical protein
VRVGIGRLKHRFRDKITHFHWLHKHNTATTRTGTLRTPLLTFLLRFKSMQISKGIESQHAESSRVATPIGVQPCDASALGSSYFLVFLQETFKPLEIILMRKDIHDTFLRSVEVKKHNRS